MNAAPRCTETVYHGRSGMFQCTKNALPNDTLCGTHRASLNRRKAAPTQRPATSAPAVTTIHTITVSLTWVTGEGPVFRAPYEARDTVWRHITVEQDANIRRVSGRGQVLRKDGSPGQQWVDLRFAAFTTLPEDLQAQFEAAFLEAAQS